MNNTVHGKTIENLGNRTDVKLVSFKNLHSVEYVF